MVVKVNASFLFLLLRLLIADTIPGSTTVTSTINFLLLPEPVIKVNLKRDDEEDQVISA